MWSYRNPVEIQFGPGAFASLADILDGRSYGLVTYGEDHFRSLAGQLAEAAGPALIRIEDVAPNPDVARLGAQSARFGALAAQPQVIVALGGGSVIDSAKVFAAAPGDFGRVLDYLAGRCGPDALSPLPLIAVPTTAGTGSEVTCWGTVWDADKGIKMSLSHPALYPRTAVVDPALMLGKSRELTVQTGLDALSHALESLWNRNANPVSMSHAVSAAREILAALPALAGDLGNLALRERVSRAALLAGLAFSNTKTAIAHSLSYPITLRHGVAHGIACSFTLPMVMRSLDGADGPHREGLERIFGASSSAAADRLEAMLDDLGVSTDPHAYGLSPEEWSGIVWAAVDGERGQNFIGTRTQLLAAAGCAEPIRAIND